VSLTGFSDEVSCTISYSTADSAYLLIVSGGFNSQTFTGGSFSFMISEIRNPFTTADIDDFYL
jgi:hypothetical protein